MPTPLILLLWLITIALAGLVVARPALTVARGGKVLTVVCVPAVKPEEQAEQE
jgi:hypothetical protein